jgi:hypothetical protein
MPIPLASQSGSFCWKFLFVHSTEHFARADIPCILQNDVGNAARSTQPVTLYITVKITPPNLYSSPSIRTKDNDSPAEEATIPSPVPLPTPEHHLPLSHHQPVETGNTKPHSREKISPSSTNNPRLALDRADESMKRVDQSNTWERAVGRIKWVMDTLGPIAEVRVMPF